MSIFNTLGTPRFSVVVPDGDRWRILSDTWSREAAEADLRDLEAEWPDACIADWSRSDADLPELPDGGAA